MTFVPFQTIPNLVIMRFERNVSADTNTCMSATGLVPLTFLEDYPQRLFQALVYLAH